MSVKGVFDYGRHFQCRRGESHVLCYKTRGSMGHLLEQARIGAQERRREGRIHGKENHNGRRVYDPRRNLGSGVFAAACLQPVFLGEIFPGSFFGEDVDVNVRIIPGERSGPAFVALETASDWRSPRPAQRIVARSAVETSFFTKFLATVFLKTLRGNSSFPPRPGRGNRPVPCVKPPRLSGRYRPPLLRIHSASPSNTGR